MQFSSIVKIFGFILIILGVIPFLFLYNVISFDVSLINDYLIYVLCIAGLISLFTSFQYVFFGKKSWSIVIGLLSAVLGCYLVGVKLGYVTQMFEIPIVVINIALIIDGIYLLLRKHVYKNE